MPNDRILAKHVYLAELSNLYYKDISNRGLDMGEAHCNTFYTPLMRFLEKNLIFLKWRFKDGIS